MTTSPSTAYAPAHGGYPGRPQSASATCMSGDRACLAGGYAHIAKFHDMAVAVGRAKTEAAMSR